MTIDIRDSLIILKNEDKTNDIESYSQTLDGKFEIVFKRNPKIYTYNSREVQIYVDPKKTYLQEDEVLFYNENAFFNIEYVLDFGDFMRVFFKGKGSKAYEKEDIRIKKSAINNVNSTEIMDYWRTVSKYTSTSKTIESQNDFLFKEFSKLTFVHPDSVLNRYINAQSLDKDYALPDHFIFPFSYNLSQKQALKQSLSSTVSIIEGPPGTGKTQTILNILANLVKTGKTVAVVSGNNAAVQNVKDKLQNRNYHFMVADLGNKDKKKAFFSNIPEKNLVNWKASNPVEKLEARIKELDGRVEKLLEYDRQLAKLKQELSAYELEQEHFENFYTNYQSEFSNKLMWYKVTSNRAIEFMKDSFLAQKKNKSEHFFYKFKLIFKYGFTNFDNLRENEFNVIVQIQKEFYNAKIKETSKEIEKLQKKLNQQKYQELMIEHQQYSTEWFENWLYKKYHHASATTFDESTYVHAKNFSSFIEQYPIMLSTTHSLRNCIPTHFLFDFCIIDESSQVDLLTGALALSCCKQAIIVGDTKQLPHIVEASLHEKLDGISANESYDYIKHNLLSSVFSVYGEDVPKTMLREHYRCHPRIIEFCNRKYYNGELITFTENKTLHPSLMLWKTAPGNHMRYLNRTKSKGRYNQRELDVIEQEIIAAHNSEEESADIGIASPYRLQVDKAARQLKNIEIDTIHKYQGREKKIMILSTVLDRTKHGNMGMKFVNDPNKINVAVSRAQEKFILVSDREAFDRYNNEIGDLIRYMEYSTLDDNIIESEIVSIFDLLYKEYSKKLEVFRDRSEKYKRSKYYSENLMHNLLDELLSESKYKDLTLGIQILLGNVFIDLKRLSDEEREYIKNCSSVDFVIYHKMDRKPLLAIEVDGVAFHENQAEGSVQKIRDSKKDSIFSQFKLPLLRIMTNGSNEKENVRGVLDSILSSMTTKD